MSITQISRIQIRRGLQENLPQLASAEFAWTLDARKLYIGNGLLKDGAPKIGNTEILTEHSDIFSLNTAYSFKGERAGYIVTTGTSVAQPITRSWNDKFDDLANIRDFGGIGDGVTDDTDSFNRAITQLYKESLLGIETRIRRTLYVPAGTYNISAAINIPPYVKLKGDGKNATYIVQTDAAPVIASKISTILSGSSSSDIAGFFEVEDMTLRTTMESESVVTLNNCSDLMFNRVRMQGAVTNVNTPSTASCVRVENAIDSTAFLFMNCEFSDSSYAFYAKNNLKNVGFSTCAFTTLYGGISLGDTFVTGNQISSVKVSFSTFENISTYGIYGSSTASGTEHIVSAYNKFVNVGFLQTAETPYSNAIYFGGNNCYSIGDTFDKTYTTAIPAIQLNDKVSYAILPGCVIQFGKQLSTGGIEVNLLNGKPTPMYAITVGKETFPVTIDYTILRGDDQRTGTLKVVSLGSVVTSEDDYVETNDIGVNLVPIINNGVTEIFYTSTYMNKDAALKLATRTLIGNHAPAGFTPTVPGAPTNIGAY